jgi:hypothetical protein
MVGLHQRLLRVGYDKVDDAGGATGEAGCGAGEKIVHRHRAHEGQLHMGVRVDAAGHHILATGVDDWRTGGGLQINTHGDDLPVLCQHIGIEGMVSIDDGTAANQDGSHTILLTR